MTATNHVRRLDHVNIRTEDMAESVRFYERLLGLSPSIPPGIGDIKVTWMCDRGDMPVIHLTEPFSGETRFDGDDTGRLHHVAFDCDGHDAIVARLADMALPYEVNVVASIGLRQIFAMDPNGVRLELNFRED
jgi:catechol 2,3-dioxygenase-like lactoylglutathione lyase family enzyme